MIFAVFRTHVRKLKRDRAAFVLSFVVPVVFFSIFAVVFGTSRSTTRRISVAVVDEDGSETSRRFVAALKAEKGLNVVAGRVAGTQGAEAAFDRSSAEEAVRAGSVPLALIVPKGFGDTPLGFIPSPARPKLLLLADTSDPVAPQVLSGLLQKVSMTAAAASMGAAPSREGGGLVAVETRDVLGQTKKNPTSALLAAGLGVMFLLFSATGAGGALIEEAESGTLDRVLSTNVSMTRLLFGKAVYLSAVAIVQLSVMFAWGQIFFGLDLTHHVPGFLVMTAVTAAASSCFGLVLAAVSRSRTQLVALSNLIILAMSALGGSMVPRYALSETIQKLGLVTLNAWAIDGFMKVFWRDEPVTHLWPQVAVLIAASALLFALARRLARRWDVA